jgi:hypothetical protein
MQKLATNREKTGHPGKNNSGRTGEGTGKNRWREQGRTGIEALNIAITTTGER